MEKSQNKILVILSFLSIYVIWGSTYLLNKIIVSEIPAFKIAAIRFTISGVFIFVIAKLMGISLAISKKQLRNTAIAGFLFLTIGNGIVVWALKFVDSGFAALEISAMPLVILLMMRVFQGKKIRPMSMVGVVLGFIGIYLLVNQDQLIHQEGSLLSVGLIFLCMVSWATSSLFVAKADLPANFFVNTGYQMFIGGIILLGVSVSLGETWTSPMEWSEPAQLSMGILIVFGSIIAFTAFNYLLKVVSPEKVATSTYVNPIVALLLGWYFLEEKVSLQSMLAAAILLTGVYFINTKKKSVIFSRFRNRRNG